MQKKSGATVKLGSVAHIFAGRPVSRLKPHPSEISARVINLRDVGPPLAPVDDLEAVYVPNTEEARRLQIEAGDVIIASRGLIRVAVAGEEHAGALLGANLVAVRLSGLMDPDVLATYIQHPQVQGVLTRGFVGSTTAGFTVDTLRSFPIRLEEGERQRALTDLVKAAADYDRAMRAALERRRSIALDIVHRELDPSSWDR